MVMMTMTSSLGRSRIYRSYYYLVSNYLNAQALESGVWYVREVRILHYANICFRSLNVSGAVNDLDNCVLKLGNLRFFP